MAPNVLQDQDYNINNIIPTWEIAIIVGLLIVFSFIIMILLKNVDGIESQMETDPYDELHKETGSSNISKATPEWQAILKQAREAIANDGQNYAGHTIEVAYYIVNQQNDQQKIWDKCENCGSPYHVDKSDATNVELYCSAECETEADLK